MLRGCLICLHWRPESATLEHLLHNYDVLYCRITPFDSRLSSVRCLVRFSFMLQNCLQLCNTPRIVVNAVRSYLP